MTWWQKKPFVDVINAYDQTSQREQKIIALTLISILCLFGYLWVVEPLIIRIKTEYDNIQLTIDSNKELKHQITKNREREFLDPNNTLRAQLSEVLTQGEVMQEKINSLTQALVAPRQMINLLEQVLTQDKQLKLISLNNLPEKKMNIEGDALTEKSDFKKSILAAGKKTDSEEALIYKHTFEIELESTYPSTVSYLKRLDNLPWQLFWQSLQYESTEYPKGSLKIKIYTLSTSKEVLGV
jgi:MSHA biogenesis protein MshJ